MAVPARRNAAPGTAESPNGREGDRSSLEAILSAALDTFVQYGFHGTPVRDLATKAGVSVPALYYHFPSKHDLLLALLLRSQRDLVSDCEAALASAKDDPAKQLKALVMALVRFYTSRRDEALIGVVELRSLSAEARPQIVSLRDRTIALFDEVIERGTAAGEFRFAFPQEARRAIVGMCVAIPTWYRDDGEYTPEQLAKRYAEIALRVVDYRVA
jgi:AcrR family transcriptional regulator